MKISSTFRVGLGLALWGAATAAAVQVTFQVNTSIQHALGIFDPAADGVFVAGDAINGWSATASELTRSATDTNVWTGTFDVPGNEGDTVQYKFLFNTADGARWEGQVGPGGGDGNRTFVLAATDQVLPVVYFNNLTNAAGVKPNVTFRVDLSVQIAAGNFDPASGTVSVAGEFNNWNTGAFSLAPSATEQGIWLGTTQIAGATDSTVAYKFVLNGGTWEGNVGPNGTQNRTFMLTGSDQVLPTVFFNNAAGEPTVIPVTFQVNLGVPMAQGRFDPATGTVSVAGDPLNSWNASSLPLSRSTTNSSVWEGTIDVTASRGSTILYKFVLNDGTPWEGGDNRTYTLTSTNAQIVPVAYFDRIDNLGLVTLTKTNDQATLTWTGGPFIRLQRSSTLTAAPWEDVPNTQGQNSISLPLGNGNGFFRLIGP